MPEHSLTTTGTIVAQVLNILEHQYGIEGVGDLGPPTLEEITDRVEVLLRDEADTGERLSLTELIREQGMDPAAFGFNPVDAQTVRDFVQAAIDQGLGWGSRYGGEELTTNDVLAALDRLVADNERLKAALEDREDQGES